MYQELQSLKVARRESHTVDAPSLTFTELDPENTMIMRHVTINKDNIALLDSASTVLIFKDQTYFEFQT